MPTNFHKTFVWKHEYDVKLWRHKERTPNTNEDHMPLNETPSWKFSAYATVFHCSLSSVVNQIRLKIDFLQLQKLFTALGVVTAFLSWCWSIYMPGQISNHQFWCCTRSWNYHSHNFSTKLLIVIGDCNWLILNHMIAVNAGLQKILQTRLIKNIKWWFCFLLQVFRFVSKNVITLFCSFTPVWRRSWVHAFGAIVHSNCKIFVHIFFLFICLHAA